MVAYYTIKDIAIWDNSEQAGTTICCLSVYPEHAEGSVLSRLVDETHCRARFRIVETERQRSSDAVVEVRPISRRGQPRTLVSGACSHTIPKPLRIKAFMGSVPAEFITVRTPRPFQHPPGNSRLRGGLLPDSEVIQRVEIAESPVKRAFRGVRPPPVPHQGSQTHV